MDVPEDSEQERWQAAY